MNPKTISFLLTIATQGTGRDQSDIVRARILITTFLECFAMDELGEFLIVTPECDLDAVGAALQSMTCDKRFCVLAETSVCPEFEGDPPTYSPWPSRGKGWYRQQVIKLAISSRVQTSHYVTLDSDVLCTRSFGVSSLFEKGRALCNVQKERDFRALFSRPHARRNREEKFRRVKDAERVLALVRPVKYRKRLYGETPVIMHTDGVRELAEHLSGVHGVPWREALIATLPWTEYELYFQFLEERGLFRSRYVVGSRNSVLRLDDSLWAREGEYREPESLENWPVADVFRRKKGGPFAVIQSYLGYPIDDVVEKLRGHVDLRQVGKTC